MSGLKEYDVVINGFPTTLRMSERDAKAAGVWREPAPEPKPAEVKQAPAPKNKARSARKKG